MPTFASCTLPQVRLHPERNSKEQQPPLHHITAKIIFRAMTLRDNHQRFALAQLRPCVSQDSQEQ